MIYTIPDYYHEFTCTADQCEDTCCAGWEIVVDHKSLRRYHKEQGPYRKKLRKAVNWKRETFRQDAEKRCAFLKSDNLCEMYQQLGADSLCKTCRMYPRHVEEFEDVREISLSLSCPEVARLVLKREDKVTFRSVERGKEETYDDFDPLLYSQLLDAREILLKIIQNRTHPVLERMFLCLGLAWDMEKRVKQGNLFSCGELFKAYEGEAYIGAARKRAKVFYIDEMRRYQFSKKNFSMLSELELLRKDWGQQQTESAYILFGRGRQGYERLQKAFRVWMEGNETIRWELISEQLNVYFLFTYFCGAVYDERIFMNMQMAAFSVSVIWDMMAATWKKNGNSLDMEDVISLVYRYCRELEHSEDNLKRLWRLLEKEKRLYL